MSDSKRRTQFGIDAVCFGAREATLSEGFDGSRVDDTHHVTRLMQKEGERLTVSAGGFQTGVDSLDAPARKPLP
jgi:hypothetical protein